eukprot:scaffold65039_cov45-Tisochrysis_lutea.AAC.1
MSTVTPCLVVFARATAASARCASSETSIESSSSGSLWRSAMTLSKRLSPSGARAELSLSISRRAFSARAIASSLRSFAPLLSSIRTMGSCPAPAAIMSAFSFALAGPSKSALAFTSSRAGRLAVQVRLVNEVGAHILTREKGAQALSLAGFRRDEDCCLAHIVGLVHLGPFVYENDGTLRRVGADCGHQRRHAAHVDVVHEGGVLDQELQGDPGVSGAARAVDG